MDLWGEITREDLDGDMQDVADALGVDTAKKLLVMFSGEVLYFPKVESVIRATRDRRIYKEFNGYNYRELARTHQLSTRQIRIIIQEQRRKNPKSKVRDMDLFDKS